MDTTPQQELLVVEVVVRRMFDREGRASRTVSSVRRVGAVVAVARQRLLSAVQAAQAGQAVVATDRQVELVVDLSDLAVGVAGLPPPEGLEERPGVARPARVTPGLQEWAVPGSPPQLRPGSRDLVAAVVDDSVAAPEAPARTSPRVAVAAAAART